MNALLAHAVQARRLRRPVELALLGLAPCLFFVQMLVLAADTAGLAVDFHHHIRPAALAILDARSPYPDPDDPVIATGVAYAYPPLAALLALPTTFMPASVADLLVTALLTALVPVILAVCGVRDWRCYGAAFLSAPTFAAVHAGNLTLLLALALALAWRFRVRAVVAGVACGIAVALKLFLWPVALWLLLVHGRRAAAAAIATAVGGVVGSWILIGFDGIAAYPELLRALAATWAGHSYTVFAAALDVGAPESLARTAAVMVGGALIAAGIAVARRGDPARSLALFVAAALVLSPIVWLHYFALLLVPLAVLRPRFTPLWLAPAVLWMVTGNGNGAGWQTILTLGVFAAVTFALVRGAPRRRAGAGAPVAPLPARDAAG